MVWLSHGHRLVRASPEQLRPASLREWRAAREADQPQTVERALHQARHRDYIDLDSDEVPATDGSGPVPTVETEPLEDLPEPEREESVRTEHVPVDLDPAEVPVPDDDFSEEGSDPLLFGDHLEFWTPDPSHC